VAVSSRAELDVIVVGSGLGGLSAAALLARGGLRVAVVERNDHPGGCAQAFRRGDYLFDPAIHITLEAAPGVFTSNLLEHLGVGDRVRFVTTEHTYRARYPDLTIEAPPGRQEFLEHHQRLFPHEADGLARLFETRAALFEQLSLLPQKLDARGIEDAMAAAPLVFRYRTATVADVLREFLSDPRVIAAMSSLWPYVGSPPSRLSFLLFNQMLESFHLGAYYPLGGFKTLVDAFAASIARDDGELLLGAEVTRVVVEDGRAVGVELADGAILTARAVISNADTRHTFGDLVGWDHVPPGYRRRFDRYRLSPSAFAIYGVLHADPLALGLGHENFAFGGWDHERTWADVEAGRPGGIWLNVPTLLDASLAPAGEHLAILTGLAPHADGGWHDRRDGYAAALLDAIDGLVPDARDAIEIVDVATPDTLASFTRNQGGAIYGWENTPMQTASKRLAHRTPVDGLFLSGHWTEEGSGSFRVMTSGRAVAAMVASDLGLPDAVPSLGGGSLAPRS
jgi:phytoene desaturase